MLEFDLHRAILMTYSGLGAAFAVLIFLIIFTLLIRLVGQMRERSGVASAAGSVESPPELPQQVQVVAPTDLPGDEASGADGFGVTALMEDWKNYGRLEAFLSRRVRRRGS